MTATAQGAPPEVPPTDPSRSPPPSGPPVALSDYGSFPYDFITWLRRFRLVGELMREGHRSLRRVGKEIERRKENDLLPDDVPHSFSCIAKIESALSPFFEEVFGRRIKLFDKQECGQQCLGLTADGWEAWRLTVAFLDEVDARRRRRRKS